MGMVGSYVALDNSQLKQVMDGEVDVLNLDPNEYSTVDIDKAWQAIHYLFCDGLDDGEPPMSYVVPMMESNMIGCDEGFVSFYITAEQVKEASEYLNSLNEDAVKERYNFEAMQKDEVYPVFDEEDEFYEYLYYNLMKAKTFFKETAEQGKAVVFYIC